MGVSQGVVGSHGYAHSIFDVFKDTLGNVSLLVVADVILLVECSAPVQQQETLALPEGPSLHFLNPFYTKLNQKSQHNIWERQIIHHGLVVRSHIL